MVCGAYPSTKDGIPSGSGDTIVPSRDMGWPFVVCRYIQQGVCPAVVGIPYGRYSSGKSGRCCRRRTHRFDSAALIIIISETASRQDARLTRRQVQETKGHAWSVYPTAVSGRQFRVVVVVVVVTASLANFWLCNFDHILSFTRRPGNRYQHCHGSTGWSRVTYMVL
jgi:hypothetical protein